jgi:Na+/proline symporter
VLFVLSVIDGALTLWGLGLGAIEEVNPVMQWLIEKGPVAFMAVKLLLPVILGLIFWKIRNRSRKFVACSLGLVLIVYVVVMVLHVYWIVFYE